MASIRRAFVVMPFGKKKAPDGVEIDFDAIYADLLAPAISAAGLAPHRADADRRGGSIHLDMFQDLLLAEFEPAAIAQMSAGAQLQLVKSLMRNVVERRTDADTVAIAAYVASLQP